MSKLRDDIGWMITHSWDCGDDSGDVAVLNTDALKDKLERYIADRLREVAELKRERDALREDADAYRWAIQHAAWHRSTDCAHVAIPVAQGANLSCVAFRDLEVKSAMRRSLAAQEVARG